jgi:hypothetical protein
MKVWIVRGDFKVLLLVMPLMADCLPGETDFFWTPEDLTDLALILAGPLELSLALCC